MNCIKCGRPNKIVCKGMCGSCYKEQKRQSLQKIECLCGCGTLIPFRTSKNKPAYFALGHNFKGMFNPNIKDSSEFYTENGRLVVKKIGHPNATPAGFILKDRLIMEEHIGRLLERWEIVEHINGNNGDNNIDNLRIKSYGVFPSKYHKIDMTGRRCSEPSCKNPTETQKDARGTPNWFKGKDGNWLCKRCYNKLKNREKRKK